MCVCVCQKFDMQQTAIILFINFAAIQVGFVNSLAFAKSAKSPNRPSVKHNHRIRRNQEESREKQRIPDTNLTRFRKITAEHGKFAENCEKMALCGTMWHVFVL